MKENKACLSWKKYVLVLVCLALIALCIFAIVKANIENDADDIKIPGGDKNYQVTVPVLYEEWNGISVSFELYKELLNAKDTDSFDIAVSLYHTIPDDYLYNGRLFDEYIAELKEAESFLKKAEYLLDEGELLKYGEVLYTDGTPNGTKWKKTMYDKTIQYYGEDFLNIYIVNGEFLKEKLSCDVEDAKNKTDSLKTTIEDAKKALIVSNINEGLKVFKKINSSAVIKEEQICLTLTKEQLSNISIENKEKYTFYLASEY